MKSTEFQGVRIRGNSIVIDFRYKGIRCRETLHIRPTRNNLKYAANLRATILTDIAKGTFEYRKYFPDSPRVLHREKPNSDITIGELLQSWLQVSKHRLAHSTWMEYSKTIECHLLPEFGNLYASQLDSARIRQWIARLSSLGMNPKTINNIMTPLRQALGDAYADEIIDKNPMDRIRNLKICPREPDPFTLKEMHAILSHMKGQVRNYFQFAFWTGLRTSELIALKWEDVDFSNGYVYVRRAKVRGKIKAPKTSAGIRRVGLLEEARKALLDQMHYSFERYQEVFLNPETNRPWASDKALRETYWTKALKEAGIRFRPPYQTRHTYASMMLGSVPIVL